MTFEQLIEKNKFLIAELLRQNHVIYSDLSDGIRKAYAQHGDSFAVKLVRILSSGTTLSNSDNEMGPPPPPGSYTDSEGRTIVPGSDSKESFWGIWSNLLSFVGQTGLTYNQFMQNVKGGKDTEAVPYQNEGAKYTWLYVAGGVLLVIVVLILIFRKK